jgi:hypothetical protein
MARLALILAVLSAAPALAEREDPTAHLNDERDILIDKITKGVDLEASIRRFGELVKERESKVATTQAAIDKERAQQQKDREERDKLRKARDEYRKTLDYEVSWRCTLSPDPANPLPSTEGRFKPDWGKVVRKEKTRLPPKNELDEGEPVTMYEVKGVARNYQFRGERFSPDRKPFEAGVGDLVLICVSSEDTPREVPAGWGPRLVTSGFAGRIAQAPAITKKTRWNPIHITGSAFFWAVKDVKWKWAGQFVLSHIELVKEVAPNQWEIAGDQDKTWIMEVPANVKNRDILKPNAGVWAILGNHRFDKGLKKLVLVAEDLEARYVTER